MTSIAVIGAGLSGLACARELKKRADVQIFEKSRGVSGRMSTRRTDSSTFDHGAQFFTAKSERFKSFLAPLIADDTVQIWPALFAEVQDGKINQTRDWGEEYPHYVGSPGMNAVGKYLSEDMDVKLGVKITELINQDGQWHLLDENKNRSGPFDYVISAMPAAQAADLLPKECDQYTRISKTEMDACFAVMLGFDEGLDIPFNAAHVSGHDISWISVNASKPERPDEFSLLIHSTNAYANQHIDGDREQVLKHLIADTCHVLDMELSQAQHTAIHGWRYANIGKQSGPTYILDEKLNIGVCGDWLIEGRVEAAFLSGDDLAQKLLERL